MRFYKYLTAVFTALAMSLAAIPAWAAGTEQANQMMETTAETDTIDDTILVDEESLWNGEIPSDIRWKMKQENGQWIETLEGMDGANSLILVVDNPGQTSDDGITDGSSVLTYLSKNAEGEWKEIFSTSCWILEGELEERTSLYGVYDLSRAFGNQKNPGSLLPYRELAGDEYWILNPGDERYGDLHVARSSADKVAGSLNLKSMKVFFDYGMVAKARDEERENVALLLNCYQETSRQELFTGIQIPEASLRMLIQCADEDTCMMVVGKPSDLFAMQREPVQ